jgi:hypothetical protein
MKKIQDTFKKIFHRTDFSGFSVFGRGEHFDWDVLLIFFLLVLVVTVSFSVRVFLGVLAGDIFGTGLPAVHVVGIDTKTLSSTIKTFEVRSETLKGLQTKKPVFVDPSL